MEEDSKIKKPVTGAWQIKPYSCEECGHEVEFGTNHWGKVYNLTCRVCGDWRTWICSEPCPDTHDLPAEWTKVKLGDVAEVVKI